MACTPAHYKNILTLDKAWALSCPISISSTYAFRGRAQQHDLSVMYEGLKYAAASDRIADLTKRGVWSHGRLTDNRKIKRWWIRILQGAAGNSSWTGPCSVRPYQTEPQSLAILQGTLNITFTLSLLCFKWGHFHW